MLKSYVITISGDKESFRQADVLIDSSNHFNDFEAPSKFIATVPENVVKTFQEEKLKWNYPWTKGVLDIQSGLFKTPYRTADPKKRMACFMSHYRLWKKCVESDHPIMIFEHDAKFIRKFDLGELDNCPYSVVSLNDPRGATRKSKIYHELISEKSLSPVPWIDELTVPQGLPGNSAYYLTVMGAKKLISNTKEYGAWPNDALMCNQLMPKMLGCLGNYATVVQATSQSSTSDV